MKCKLFRFNKEPIEINVSDIIKVVPYSVPLVEVWLKDGTKRMGYLLRFE